jgi:hypothetical protein
MFRVDNLVRAFARLALIGFTTFGIEFNWNERRAAIYKM